MDTDRTAQGYANAIRLRDVSDPFVRLYRYMQKEFTFLERYSLRGAVNKHITFEMGEDPYADRRCIGCGRWLKKDRNWNQCGDCDTRTPEDY